MRPTDLVVAQEPSSARTLYMLPHPHICMSFDYYSVYYLDPIDIVL